MNTSSQNQFTTSKRTNSTDPDFVLLVSLLNVELAKRNGSENDFYTQFNKIDMINNVIVYYCGDVPAGCGAFKAYDGQSEEIKRMFVKPEFRRQHAGARILKALEQWAGELNYTGTLLETGKVNPEAIALYQKEGYAIIPNYGQYAGVENSVCMKKTF